MAVGSNKTHAHRAELTVQERSDQIAEWAELVEQRDRISAQSAQKIGRGRPEGGESQAARDMNLSRRHRVGLTREAILAPP